MVWRHDLTANQYFSLAGYFRHTRATFNTDPFNVLAYTPEVEEPFSAAHQDRNAYSGGIRFDYTNVLNSHHLLKAGFQIDRTQAINKTRLFVFERDPGTGDPIGSVVPRNADNRLIGYRQELWVQDQWTPNDQWTFNLGVRGDIIQYQLNEGQVSPRVGATYKANQANVFHAFYGRMFTPPNLEAISFAKLNTIGTTAEPENLTNNKVRAERAHYFEVGSYHAITKKVTLELTGYYKLNRFMSDAGQFGTTPLLNFFAFERGWQRGIDGAVKVQFTDNLYGRGNVAWGQCKGYGLQSGLFLLEQAEIDAINSRGGVFCDHSQFMTSSAVLTYRLLEHTTITGQMLYGSGLRTAVAGGKTNSTHEDSYTVYNLSLTHVFPLPNRQKLLVGFDVINLLDEQYFYNRGEGSIGLDVAHAGMPRSFFFRTQWIF
jgi:outer membrane receptor protein involved in Fe transport